MLVGNNRENIAELLKKGILVSPDFVDYADASFESGGDILVLNRDSKELAEKKESGINWKELEKVRVLYERGKASLPSVDDLAPSGVQGQKDVEIVASYRCDQQKLSVSHFTNYFNTRYRLLERVLRARPELQNLTLIRRLKDSASPNSISVIGLVNEKQETKNKNILLTLEDPTGQQRVLISRNRADLFGEASDIVLDEVVGVSGSYKQGMVFANSITFPDTPSLELKKSPDEEYMACMSDLHFGSKQFMHEEFNRFLSWVNLETGSPGQKRMAEKLKYILVAGDIVDGVGIYNNQQAELSITDPKKQYEECANFLSEIPSNIKIIIAPGNHDAIRMAEPQPPLDNQFTEPLKKLKNALFVSNPATVRVGIKENFSGFNCLLYHGYSFDYYISNVDSIRRGGGYDRADLIMKFLLKRHHLAPSHTSTLIAPTPDYDALFIDPVPDFFVTGHVHRTSVSNYKSTTLISGSCWQSMTSFQERLGHNPQPARLPVINLKTRDASIIRFGK